MLQVRLRSEEDVREGRTTPELEEAEFQKVCADIDSGKKPCDPEDRAWFEGCLGTDKVCSCLQAIQKAEILKALSDSKLMDKVRASLYYIHMWRLLMLRYCISCSDIALQDMVVGSFKARLPAD